MAATTPPPTRVPWRRSPLTAALLGWALPGLGQLYVGRPVKGALFLVAILPTFLVGWHLTGYTIVDPERYGLDFAAQVLIGAPTLLALELGADRVLEHLPRFFDTGRLYVLIAGLLNLVAVYDAVGDAILHNRRVLDLRLFRREAERAEEEARAAAAFPDESLGPPQGAWGRDVTP